MILILNYGLHILRLFLIRFVQCIILSNIFFNVLCVIFIIIYIVYNCIAFDMMLCNILYIFYLCNTLLLEQKGAPRQPNTIYLFTSMPVITNIV